MVQPSFAETAVLIAVMNGDDDEADRLLNDFLKNELRTFEEQVGRLADAINRAQTRKGDI